MLRSTANVEASQFGHGPTLYRTGSNRYWQSCVMCGEIWFVDASLVRRVSHAILEGLNSPFLCPNCDPGEEEVWRFAE